MSWCLQVLSVDRLEEWSQITEHLSREVTVTVMLADKDKYHESTDKEEAVAEAAEELGFVAPQLTALLQQEKQELAARNIECERRVHELEGQVRDL